MVDSTDWFRIGIDVGGTFTHAVAVSGTSGEIIGSVKVLTTHRDSRGTAAGIEEVLRKLLAQTGIPIPQVRLMAHCTTQTTNALLEGDLPPVGLVVLSSPGVPDRIMRQSIPPELTITRGKSIPVLSSIIDSSVADDVEPLVKQLVAQGATTFAVTRPFGVEDPQIEEGWAEKIRDLGHPAIAATSLSGLYGMKARTQTALLNAALLPEMLKTARNTESALHNVGFTQTMLVMRSDGGVLTLPEVEKRPILTILSGPAAGVAGALFYQKLVRGILIEVGGTSTDISMIVDGRPRLRSAEVGGHRLYLRTLDIRTVGVAGGSLLRVSGKQLIDVGPRSAHIAGLSYSCFAEQPIRNPKAIVIQPRSGDPDYLIIEDAAGTRYAVTPTCAANFLGRLESSHAAYGNRERAAEAFRALSQYFGISSEEVARKILELASRHLLKAVESLLKEVREHRHETWLVGGGGGCAVFVPVIARELRLPFQIAPHHDVFSAIGTALALLHESEEQSSQTFSFQEVEDVRRRLEEKLFQMGADPETIELSVEIDRRRGVIRGDGFGTLPQTLRKEAIESGAQGGAGEKIRHMLSQYLVVSTDQISKVSETPYLFIWKIAGESRRFLRAPRPERVVICGRDGSVRWTRSGVKIWSGATETIPTLLRQVIEDHSRWGDAGREIPPLHLVVRSRVLEFSGFLSADEAEQTIRAELQKHPPRDTVFLIV